MASKMLDSSNLVDPVKFFNNYPLILHSIFDHLSNPELLRCRRVCRSWSTESTIVLISSQRKCLASVTGGCKSVLRLDALMGLPSFSRLFNGLNIDVLKIRDDYYCWLENIEGTKCSKDVAEDCANLVNAKFRYLKVHTKPYVPLGPFVHCVLEGNSETLEEVEISYELSGDDYKANKILSEPLTKLYPKLRRITIRPSFGAPPDDTISLIKAAPNVEKLIGQLDLAELKDFNLPASQLGFLTSVQCVPYSYIRDFLSVPKDSGAQLEKLRIEENVEAEDGEVMRMIPPEVSPLLPGILDLASPTLKKLAMCAVELGKCARREGATLPTLKALEIHFPEHTTAADIIAFYRASRIQQFCPNVHRLVLNFGECCAHPLAALEISVNNTNDVGAGTDANTSAGSTVQEVSIEGFPCPTVGLETSALLIPSLTKLEFNAECFEATCRRDFGSHVDKIGNALNCLLNLREITMYISERTGLDALDALFCGFTMEEARRIRRELVSDDGAMGQLGQLQYCPVRPPLTYCRAMQLLHLFVQVDCDFDKFGFTELSEFLVFDRMPQLRVRLESYPSSVPDLQNTAANRSGFVEICAVEEEAFDW